MTFSNPDWSIKDKIELLQRAILVDSYAYYELNENLLADYQYDQNTRQLLEFKELYPAEFKKSRYYRYFNNFESGTGFDLTSRLQKNKKLYSIISHDAHLALKLKRERQ